MSNNINIVARGDYGLDEFYSGAGELADSYKDLVESCHGKKTGDVDYQAILCADKVAQKIVNIPVFDALSNWRDDLGSEIKSHDERLMFVDVIKKAARKSRLYPEGALLLPVIKYADNISNRAVSFSVPLERIVNGSRNVEIQSIAIAYENLEIGELEDDLISPNFGLPKEYKVGDLKIHHSRGILLGGECSFFHGIAPFLKDFHTMAARLHEAVRRNGSFIYKADFESAREYAQNLATVQGGNVQTELEAIASLKATCAKQNLAESNVLLIGLQEEVSQLQSQVIDDLVEALTQQMELLAGIADIPASRLFGIVKSGLGDSANRGLQNYSQALDTYRSEEIDPVLHELDKFFADVYGFEFSRAYTWNDTKAEEMILQINGKNDDNGEI